MRAAFAVPATVLALLAGCGPRLDLGSDLLWTARFETGDFVEFTDDGGGSALTFPAGNTAVVSAERTRQGGFAARLSIDTSTAGTQQNALLGRMNDLPQDAFYSAWFYLPVSVTVRTYWVIFKFQIDDPSTINQLFDLDLVNLPSREMALTLYDHRTGTLVPLDVDDPVVPVGRWFHVEAHFRSGTNGTGRITYWLDGRQVIDLPNQNIPPTVEWDACSVGEDLSPAPALIYVDDCAISRSRVGPAGILSAP